MNDKNINGKQIALSIREDIKKEVDHLYRQYNEKPCLVVVIVGQNPASKVYVKNKKIACEKACMNSRVIELSQETEESELIKLIKELNNDDSVHGILVQLPLPNQIDENKIIDTIDPLKDVDAFHPQNVGRILIGNNLFSPCTPQGIIELLKQENIKTQGQHVVIIGRSNIVGKPIAALLLQRGYFGDATVTICHSKTKNLIDITRQADILIAAIGSPDFVKEDMIKEGVTIIDVGINRVEDPETEKGYRIKGDVDYDAVLNKTHKITPVPGGVGPMTIAMLLKNTTQAFKHAKK